MKESWSLLLKSSTWLSLFVPAILSALPEGEQIVSGQVSISRPDSNSLQVHASDKSIINYDSFNIQKGESVQFIQPSKKAAVLNRVVGKDPSKIFGQLKSNGKVILVNSNGVFFSPTAQVNMGSLVVSTLDISNSDFLSDRLHFQLDPDKQASSIVNQGQLTADGSVALLAPHIQNEGIISARAGRVVLASGEKITLDFSGDGLINFMVEGELKDTSIENDGSLHAPEGDVYIHLKTAKKIIKDVVNTDGLEEGVSIVKENNTIKILSKSSILARRIEIDGGKGSDVAISGTLDVSDPSARGGEVTILGDQISLAGAQIDASGAFEGGTVLIGGDYQGQDSLHHSLLLTMDPNSTIRADALGEGNGGKVILWSDGITHFNGNIYAQAGSQGGDGGLVETSGKEGLGCHMGYVNTLALQGNMGTWLLDPQTINIVLAGTDPIPMCPTTTCSSGVANVQNTTINVATSNVTICAQTINVNAPISMTNSGVGIVFEGCGNPPTGGTINFGAGANISTSNGSISFSSPVTLFSPITLTAGTGDVLFSQRINGISQNLTINARNVTFYDGTLSSITILAINATGTVSFLPLTSNAIYNYTTLTFGLNPTAIDIGGGTNLTTINTASALTFPSPVTLLGNTAISSGALAFNSTIDGTAVRIQDLTLSTAGGNPITFAFPVGGSVALGAFSISGASAVTFASGASLTAASVTESNVNGTSTFRAINSTGDISLSGSSSTSIFDFISPVTAGGAFTLDGAQTVTFESGATLTAASVTESNVTGATTFRAINTTGDISLSGIGGANTFDFIAPVTAGGAFTLDSAQTVTFESGATLTAASVTESNVTGTSTFRAINSTGDISLSGSSTSIFDFISPVTAGGAFTLDTAQTVTFESGATLTAASVTESNVTGTSTFRAINATTGDISLSGSSTSIFDFISPVTAGGAFTLDTAQTVTFEGGATLTAASVTESNVTGATTFRAINTTGGISLSGIGGANTFDFIAPVTAGGAFSLNSAQTVTFESGAILTALSVTETAVVTAIFDKIITTGTTTSGFVSLANGLSSSYQFNADISSAGPFSINGGSIVTFASGTTLSAASITESGISGPSQFQTMIATTGPIDLTGGIFTFSGPITTQGNNGDITINGTLVAGISFFQPVMTTHGNVIINNPGLLSISPSATFSVHGDFQQVGTGPVTMGGSITTLGSDLGSNISFTSPVTLTADTLYDSSAGNGNIIFENTLDSNLVSNWDVTLAAGAGNIDFEGIVGGVSRLGTVIVLSAHDLTTVGFNAPVIEQFSGTGTTTNNGPWNLGAAPVSSMQQLMISTGAIRFGNTITLTAASAPVVFNALTDIQNLAGPVAITTTGLAFFDALNGNVGSAASPIDIENGNNVIVAGAKNSAYFQGAIFHNYLAPPPYVTDVPSNPPCFIAFNGITIKNTCKPPSPAPGGVKISAFPPRDFFFVGAYSIYDNLIGDFYFFPDFIHDYYLNSWSAALFYELPVQPVKEQVSEEYIPVEAFLPTQSF